MRDTQVLGILSLMGATDYQYMVSEAQFPYCAGCGHTMINKALDSALQKLNVKPSKVNLISDIGCVGLVDKLFLTNTIHTTHGRSTAFATGIELADSILYDSDAINVVMIGDGGATIGLLHLVEAAKFNSNITVLLHNNFVYGMTGGQNSGFTPEGFRTATTMDGSLVPAIHTAELLEAANAGFVARKLATDKDLDDTIVEAINYPGFALVEVIELCTGYATKWNSMTKQDVQDILEKMDAGKLGTLIKRDDRESYSKLYKQSFNNNGSIKEDSNEEYCAKTGASGSRIINVEKSSSLDQPLSIILAGSAGEGVQFASKVFIEAALSQGLNVMQKNDNPVTIGTGFSLSELKLSSETIYYSGATAPDYIIISSTDGLNRAKEFINNVINSDQDSTIIVEDSLIEDLRQVISSNPSKFTIINHEFRKTCPDSKSINFMMLGQLIQKLEVINLESMQESIQNNGKNTEKIVESLRAGYELN